VTYIIPPTEKRQQYIIHEESNSLITTNRILEIISNKVCAGMKNTPIPAQDLNSIE
jgi:hypothetical protein